MKSKGEKTEQEIDPSDLCAASRFASTIHTGLFFNGFPFRHNFKDSRQIIDQTKEAFPVIIQNKS